MNKPAEFTTPDFQLIVMKLKSKSRLSSPALAREMGLTGATLNTLLRSRTTRGERANYRVGKTLEVWARANFSDDELDRCGL